MVSLSTIMIPVGILIIFLIIILITTIIAASDLLVSQYYGTEPKLQSARTLLIWAAVLSAITLAILILILAIYFYNVRDVLNLNYLTTDIKVVENLIKTGTISSELATIFWFIVVMIITLIMIVAIGIICAAAANDIDKSIMRDKRADSAYTAAVFGAVLGVGALFCAVAGLVAVYFVRSSLFDYQDEINLFVKRYYNPTVSTVITTGPDQVLPPTTVFNIVAPESSKDAQITLLKAQLQVLQNN
jgi:hypothetical protein